MKKGLVIGIIILWSCPSIVSAFNEIPSSLMTSPLSSIDSGGVMDSAWPMICHDLHHTSLSPYSTANNPGLEKWRFRCELPNGHVSGGIIIGENGTLYFGDTSGYLYALHPDGSLKWKQKIDFFLLDTPALAKDGTLYIGAWDDNLHALYSNNGTEKWRFYTNHSTIASAPTIALDGTIYVGTMWSLGNGGKLHAINPDGTEKWRFQTRSDILSSPALGDDGTIFFGSYDTYVYALYPNGTVKWQYKTGDQVRGSPSIAEDGTIYIGSLDGYLYALYPNGTKKWNCRIGSFGTYANPSIGSDGTIYVGEDYLSAIYPNGTMRWRFNMGPKRTIIYSSPAISADGTIYVGTHIGDGGGGEIIAVNSDGTERWRKQIALDFIDSSPCIGEDGTVYIGSYCDTSRGYLHAFGSIESNEKPSPPIITGDVFGFPGRYSIFWFKVDDPDKNPIRLYVDWGDGTILDWTDEYAYGDNIYATHTWARYGNYTIKAKVKDVLGEESDWSSFNYEAGGTILYLVFLGGEVYESHYDSPRDEIHLKAKNLLVISLYPPLIKRYISGEQIIVDNLLFRFDDNNYFLSYICLNVYISNEQNHIGFEEYDKPIIAERFPNAFPLLRQLTNK